MIPKVILVVAITFLVYSQVFSETESVSVKASQSALENASKMKLLNLSQLELRKLYRLLGGSGKIDRSNSAADTIDDSYFQKREYDDYGHMRFGKRGNTNFDDYGHMRFGKRDQTKDFDDYGHMRFGRK